MVNFSRINRDLPSRNIGKLVEKEKNSKPEIKAGETDEEKRDLFNTYAGLLIPMMWERIMTELEKIKLEIDLEKGMDMHKKLFESYPKLLQNAEHNYTYNLADRAKIKNQNGEEFSDEEIYYINILMNNLFKGGLPNLSSLDAVYIFIHLAEVIQNLVKNKEDFERILNSKNVQIFMNSLLMNDRTSLLIFMGIFASKKGFTELDTEDYHFDQTLFYLDESGNFRVKSELLEKMKEFIKKKTTEKDVRYCPALWAGDTVRIIFDWVKKELTKQYKANWDVIKS